MKSNEQTALRISAVNIVINIVLAVVKLTVGAVSHSEALLSDGVHSVTDIFSSLVVMIGVKLSARRSDAKHPYGHERMECVAAVILAVFVGATGIGIGVSGLESILTIRQEAPTVPGGAALVTAVAAVLVKEIMFRYTRRAAVKTGSGALMADAWHLRTDALSSLGGFVGVLGANLGLAVLDPAAAVLISMLIIKAALEIFADAMRKMTDRSCDEDLQLRIQEQIAAQEGVEQIEVLKTRLFGNRVYVEVTVGVNGEMSSKAAYEIAQTIHRVIETDFEEVKECAVHIRPL